MRDKLTTPAGVCFNVPGGAIMHRAKRIEEPLNDYFVITKLVGLEPAQFVGRGKFGVDQSRSATNMTVKNTLQRKMPGLPGKRH